MSATELNAILVGCAYYWLAWSTLVILAWLTVITGNIPMIIFLFMVVAATGGLVDYQGSILFPGIEDLNKDHVNHCLAQSVPFATMIFGTAASVVALDFLLKVIAEARFLSFTETLVLIGVWLIVHTCVKLEFSRNVWSCVHRRQKRLNGEF